MALALRPISRIVNCGQRCYQCNGFDKEKCKQWQARNVLNDKKFSPNGMGLPFGIKD